MIHAIYLDEDGNRTSESVETSADIPPRRVPSEIPQVGNLLRGKQRRMSLAERAGYARFGLTSDN